MFKCSLGLFILFVSLSVYAQDVMPEKNITKNNKIEDLIIWKMSEELQLNVKEEKQFSETFKDLNKTKQSINQDLQNHLAGAAEVKTKAGSERFLKDYEGLLKKYNELSIQEVDRMKKILGAQRTLQYIAVKNDLNNRVKQLLLNPKSETKTSPQTPAEKPVPKVIIEQ